MREVCTRCLLFCTAFEHCLQSEINCSQSFLTERHNHENYSTVTVCCGQQIANALSVAHIKANHSATKCWLVCENNGEQRVPYLSFWCRGNMDHLFNVHQLKCTRLQRNDIPFITAKQAQPANCNKTQETFAKANWWHVTHTQCFCCSPN